MSVDFWSLFAVMAPERARGLAERVAAVEVFADIIGPDEETLARMRSAEVALDVEALAAAYAGAHPAAEFRGRRRRGDRAGARRKPGPLGGRYARALTTQASV